MCDDFYSNQLCLQSINGSYITLIPKKDDAQKVSDFRPISLLNTSVKIITKLLANRLQRTLPSLLHKNQYGFIKKEQFKIALPGPLNICICVTAGASRKEIIILKLDFEKEFDKVEHDFMLQIMDQKRPPRWLQWMKAIFKSGTSAVLLNGIPGKVFHCRRGVRQGDPLSSLLFVLAADFLQSFLNNARVNNLLSLPLPLTHDLDFPILQYADDTLIFMKGDVTELIHLKEILSNFAEASSLKVN